MDSDGAKEAGPPPAFDERSNLQLDNAIRAIREKKPLPEIDFTIHTMEDGTDVSTLERVCKGIPRSLAGPSPARPCCPCRRSLGGSRCPAVSALID
jgi:hypothetical protein